MNRSPMSEGTRQLAAFHDTLQAIKKNVLVQAIGSVFGAPVAPLRGMRAGGSAVRVSPGFGGASKLFQVAHKKRVRGVSN
jgi:hypothetical protein